MFRRSIQPFQVILYYVDYEFQSKRPNLVSNNLLDKLPWRRVLSIAEANGLLHPFCTKFLEETPMSEKSDSIKRKIRDEDKELFRFQKTMKVVQHLLKKGDIDFMFIKLYRGIPYVPRDVDILLKREDLQAAVSLFRKNGFNVEAFSDVEIGCERPDLLKVDLYCGFYYVSLPFLDTKFLWENQRIVNIFGVNCIIPSFEADFLSLVIHSLLGHRRLSLLDFLYAKNLLHSEYLNFEDMLRETEKYGWTSAFIRVTEKIRDIYNRLYFKANTPRSLDFPYIFSTKFVLGGFQSFAGLGVNTKIKFLLSAVLDATYHRYISVRYVIPFELPDIVKNFIANRLYEVRKQRGDRKRFFN